MPTTRSRGRGRSKGRIVIGQVARTGMPGKSRAARTSSGLLRGDARRGALRSGSGDRSRILLGVQLDVQRLQPAPIQDRQRDVPPDRAGIPPTQISVTASAGTEMGERWSWSGRGEGHVPHIPGVGDAIDAEKDLRCLVGDGAARPAPVAILFGAWGSPNPALSARPPRRRTTLRPPWPSAFPPAVRPARRAGGEQAHEDHGDDRGRRVHARPGARATTRPGSSSSSTSPRRGSVGAAAARHANDSPRPRREPLACHDVPRCGTRSPPARSSRRVRGRRLIEYRVRRSARSRGLRVTIDPRAGVLVSVPPPTRRGWAQPEARIEAFLREREAWSCDTSSRWNGTQELPPPAAGPATVASLLSV